MKISYDSRNSAAKKTNQKAFTVNTLDASEDNKNRSWPSLVAVLVQRSNENRPGNSPVTGFGNVFSNT